MMELHEYIESKLNEPFKWGSNDCVNFVAGWIKEKTGKDFLSDLPKWDTARKALRIAKSFGGLQSAVDDKLSRINPHMAQNGSVGFVRGNLALFYGPHLIGPSYTGLIYVDRMEAVCAWDVI